MSGLSFTTNPEQPTEPAATMPPVYVETPGRDALWLWFSLSYASWLTLPRVMIHEMPDEWQAKMAELLNEWDETWLNCPDIGARVQVTDMRGHLIKTPDYIINYRHPDIQTINRFRGKVNADANPTT